MRRAFLVAIGAALLSQGCVYKMTGGVMRDYTVDHMGPYLLGSSDLGMACETGVSMGAFLMSFERVTDPPDIPAILTLLAAATCAEEVAWSEELRHLRALKAGQVDEAQDARTAEKRAHAAAASRFYRAFQRAERAFKIGEGEECPDLDEESHQLAFLLGQVSVVQGLVHDRAADGAVGIPMDAPARAGRALNCLNNEQWWGMPQAIQAGIWMSVPGTLPEGKDAWAEMEKAATIGDQKGIRAARAVALQAMATTGKTEGLQAAITKFAKAGNVETPSAWSMLDALAERQALALSDRLWTEAKGQRTPFGGLGTFWEEETDDDDDADDLLGDDEEEEEATPAPASQPAGS